jgi:hypothetical protein
MLMLYLFKVEVFDLGLNYSYATNTVVIADIKEDRGRLLRCQFDGHNGSAVKRSVLLGARGLTLRETKLLADLAGTKESVWLMTRIPPTRCGHPVLHLPRLYDECDMLELELLDRAGSYDSTPLMDDQYMHSVWFSKAGVSAMPFRVAA